MSENYWTYKGESVSEWSGTLTTRWAVAWNETADTVIKQAEVLQGLEGQELAEEMVSRLSSAGSPDLFRTLCYGKCSWIACCFTIETDWTGENVTLSLDMSADDEYGWVVEELNVRGCDYDSAKDAEKTVAGIIEQLDADLIVVTTEIYS